MVLFYQFNINLCILTDIANIAYLVSLNTLGAVKGLRQRIFFAKNDNIPELKTSLLTLNRLKCILLYLLFCS